VATAKVASAMARVPSGTRRNRFMLNSCDKTFI
jgi:hypothetical protein